MLNVLYSLTRESIQKATWCPQDLIRLQIQFKRPDNYIIYMLAFHILTTWLED